MGISLSKGGNINLSKEAPGLSKIRVGLGWDPLQTSGEAYDLDASVVLFDDARHARNEGDFIFYNNLTTPNGSVKHLGDNRTGDGDGDDETILVDLDLVDADVKGLVFIVSIDQADARGQNFGGVNGAYIHLYDDATGVEVVSYDLTEDASLDTSLIFAELYRNGSDWKFKAVGQGFNNGLEGVINTFELKVG